jgi:hypothetical protein
MKSSKKTLYEFASHIPQKAPTRSIGSATNEYCIRTLLISLSSGSYNGHICTLDSGGVLALHLWVDARVCMVRGIHMHNMFLSGTDFWGGTRIRRTTPFREAWVLTPLMPFPCMHGLTDITATTQRAIVSSTHAKEAMNRHQAYPHILYILQKAR